ncbi:BA75_04699T0 [Komagataella pastoris]|uniref:Phosphotransferase n=1 Tax=Komagataella pastoris TaxID=4922 RepID=A0A1B2JHD7_PICPA|nr:BA75_04699T0 [Komagataella pastoris]
MSLQEAVKEIQSSFDVSQEVLQRSVDKFIELAKKGLASNEDKLGMPMLPAYVTQVPTGKEKGTYLAADLGGTNFRVCSVHLKGDNTFNLVQQKSPIPADMMVGTGDQLFAYLASKIRKFLEDHHGDALEAAHETNSRANYLKLGFTFSFPTAQHSLDSGSLVRWTKGFNIPDVVDHDVVQLLQKHLDAGKIPVHVAALANDTVGTLLSRAYSANAIAGGKQGETIIGAIFGTGTNGAYLEKLDNIKKLPEAVVKDLKAKGVTHMVINTEWGSFDNRLEVLPTTKYDKAVDALTANPGIHLFEKRVSGMFMGEILRNILVDLHSRGLVFTQYPNFESLPHRLRTPWDLDSENLSLFEVDDSKDMKPTEVTLLQALRLPTTLEERQAIQALTRAISRRSAYISAVPIAAIIMLTGALEGHHIEVDIGVDGSVVEFYPGYRTMLRDALALTQIGTKGERRTHINIAKDGSGVGAALCASVSI